VSPAWPLGARCDACGNTDARTAFLFQTRHGALVKCWRCAVQHRPMLRRSVMIGGVVGTVLLAINQGDVLLGAEWPGTHVDA
jgi:hypothetical protein